MKALCYKLLSFLLILMIGTPLYAGPGSPFNRIVLFGDSLSDNGNLYLFDFGFLPKSPPYFNGRFSNGIAWSDYVMQYYLHQYAVTLDNYAIGGQTIIFHNPFDGYNPYTFTLSLNSYLLHSIFSERSSTLFVIWLGANDYYSGISDTDQITTKVVNSLKSDIENLIYHGGMNFLIINMPNLSLTPRGLIREDHDLANVVSLLHNSKLDAAVTDIQNNYKNVNINLFDFNYVFTDFTKNPDVYNRKYNIHITNTTTSCFQGGYTRKEIPLDEASIAKRIDEHLQQQSRTFTTINTNKLDVAGYAHYIATTPDLLETYRVSEEAASGITPCANPDNYMFWDQIHPTAVIHKMISQIIIDFMTQHYQPVRG